MLDPQEYIYFIDGKPSTDKNFLIGTFLLMAKGFYFPCLSCGKMSKGIQEEVFHRVFDHNKTYLFG